VGFKSLPAFFQALQVNGIWILDGSCRHLLKDLLHSEKLLLGQSLRGPLGAPSDQSDPHLTSFLLCYMGSCLICSPTWDMSLGVLVLGSSAHLLKPARISQ
jgi:hypothetical protein